MQRLKFAEALALSQAILKEIQPYPSERDAVRAADCAVWQRQPGLAADILSRFAVGWRARHRSLFGEGRATIVVGLEKSGSTSLCAALAQLRGSVVVDFPSRRGGGLFHLSMPVKRCLRAIADLPIVIHCHVEPSDHAVEILSSFSNNPIFLHVREPRDALISRYHMAIAGRNPIFEMCKPRFYDLPRDDQLDWLIEHYLRYQASWLSGWMKAISSGKMRFQGVSTFDSLLERGQDGLAARLVTVMGGIPRTAISMSSPKRFRAGRREVWREDMSERQQRAANEKVSPEVRAWLDGIRP